MIRFHKVRHLFQGWKRFLVLVQWFFWSVLLMGFIVLGSREWSSSAESVTGRSSLFLFFSIVVAMFYCSNRSFLAGVRGLGAVALVWTTLLWVESLLPGSFFDKWGLHFLKKEGWDRVALVAFSISALYGIGYPFSWLGRRRYGWIIIWGSVVSVLGFFLLGGIVVLERGAHIICSYDLVVVTVSLVVIGSSILVRGIQDCLEEGAHCWSFIPYFAGALMFLLTMTLWSTFQIHERKNWIREMESYSTKMGDKFEQKLTTLTQELERFCLTISLREKIKLSEWRLETKVFMAHEPSIIGFERIPFISSEWSAPRFADDDMLHFLPLSSLDSALRHARSSRTVWLTEPFAISKTQKALALVGAVEPKDQSYEWIVMGFEFNSLFDLLFREESEQFYIQILAQGVVLKDFETPINLNREVPFVSDLYFHGVNFQIISLPKPVFFKNRDHFLSLGFLLAGFCFSVLFGILVGLYIQTHYDSLHLRGVNEKLGAEVRDRRRAEGETEQKNRDLETLIYVVSHDLREPLRGIESFSRLIYERYLDRLDEKGQDFLRRIVFSSMRLDRLLDDITTLSRVQRAEPPTVPVGARELVMEAMSRLETVIKAKNAKVQIDRDLPLLWVNRTWGTQAIFNLMGNALKFSPPESAPDIEIRGYISKAGDQSGIQVLDRGPGVKQEHVDRIFKLFQRAVGREVEGTGAGLAIVKQIAERHGGNAWYEPREGGGSCFTIAFASTRGKTESPEDLQ